MATVALEKRTPKHNKIQQVKKALVLALQESKGIVKQACEKVGVDRTTFYKYWNEDADFRLAAEDAQEIALDHVEGKLHELIDGVQVMEMTKDGPRVYAQPPNVTATIFYLKTKGKKRGYVEKVEVESKVTIEDDKSPENRCRNWISMYLDTKDPETGKKPTVDDAIHAFEHYVDIEGATPEIKARVAEQMRRGLLGT
jgi:hypothetical protein